MEGITLLYSFTLSAALIVAVKNILVKKLFNQRAHGHVIAVGLLFGAAAVCYAGGLVIFGWPQITPGFWKPFIITAVLNIFIQYLGHIKPLELEDASAVTPLSAISPVLVIATSYYTLGQAPTAWGVVGIILVAMGTYILGLKGKEVALPKIMRKVIPDFLQTRFTFWFGPFLRLASSLGARLAIISAVIASISINYDKLAIDYSNPLFATSAGYLVSAVAMLAWSFARGQWQKIPRSDKRTIGVKAFGIGLFFGIGSCLTNSAFLFGIVPYVSALRRTEILFTVLLGWFFLQKEREFIRIRLIAAAIMTLGVIMLAF